MHKVLHAKDARPIADNPTGELLEEKNEDIDDASDENLKNKTQTLLQSILVQCQVVAIRCRDLKSKELTLAVEAERELFSEERKNYQQVKSTYQTKDKSNYRST